MVALYDHIQQLRAELSTNPCPIERVQIAAQLAAAEAEQARLHAASAASFEEA
jgi:hypothetical protein